MGWCLIEKQGGCRPENGEGPAFEYMWVYIYVCLKNQHNSVRIRFLSYKILVLPHGI